MSLKSFFKDVEKFAKKVIAPAAAVAAPIVLPGIGGLIGGAIAGSIASKNRTPAQQQQQSPVAFPGSPGPFRRSTGVTTPGIIPGRIGEPQMSIAGFVGPTIGGVVRQLPRVLPKVLPSIAGGAAAGAAIELLTQPGVNGNGCPRGFHPAKDGSGRCVRNRRMNPCNASALRRSLRRIESYNRLNKRVEKSLRRVAPTRRRAPTRATGAHRHK